MQVAFSNLEKFYIGANHFIGAFPSSISNLTELQAFDISYNGFNGPIPHTLGRLSQLQLFSIGDNSFGSGRAHDMDFLSSLTNCTELQELGLFGNRFGGVLPYDIGNFSSYLIHLDMGRNQISGKLPEEIGQLIGLTSLVIVQNFLGGTIPDSIGKLKSLVLFVLEDNKLSAVKVLNLETRGASKSFVAECNALGKIKHRNLLKIFTCCSSVDYNGEDFKAIVFEFMPNGSLESLLHNNEQGESRNTSLNLSQRLNIALDVANALDYLHNDSEPAIVHCDIMPSNVLLDEEIVAHLGDFGLARLLHGFNREQVTSSAVKGTIGYVL